MYECGLLKQIPPGCCTAERYSIFIKESEDWLKERCKISIVFYWKCLYNTKCRTHGPKRKFVIRFVSYRLIRNPDQFL